MDGLIEGRIVHFVLENSRFKEGISGKDQTIENIICRPAIIVNAWGGKLEDGMTNLQIFLDGSNDYDYLEDDIKKMGNQLIIWNTSVKYSENKKRGTWHWPERS